MECFKRSVDDRTALDGNIYLNLIVNHDFEGIYELCESYECFDRFTFGTHCHPAAPLGLLQSQFSQQCSAGVRSMHNLLKDISGSDTRV